MGLEAQVGLGSLMQKSALHLAITAPKKAPLPRGILLATAISVTITILLPSIVLLRYANQQWGALEALYIFLPCALLSAMLLVALREQHQHSQALALHEYSYTHLEPALLLAGISAKPSEAIRFLTLGATTLDPGDNLFSAFLMTRSIDCDRQLIAVLSH